MAGRLTSTLTQDMQSVNVTECAEICNEPEDMETEDIETVAAPYSTTKSSSSSCQERHNNNTDENNSLAANTNGDDGGYATKGSAKRANTNGDDGGYATKGSAKRAKVCGSSLNPGEKKASVNSPSEYTTAAGRLLRGRANNGGDTESERTGAAADRGDGDKDTTSDSHNASTGTVTCGESSLKKPKDSGDNSGSKVEHSGDSCSARDKSRAEKKSQDHSVNTTKDTTENDTDYNKTSDRKSPQESNAAKAKCSPGAAASKEDDSPGQRKRKCQSVDEMQLHKIHREVSECKRTCHSVDDLKLYKIHREVIVCKRTCLSVDEMQLHKIHREDEDRKAAREAAVLENVRQQQGEGEKRTIGGLGRAREREELQLRLQDSTGGGTGRQMFVADWEFVQTLGEGAYGEVKLAYCARTQEAVAVKIINLKDATKGALDDVKKEICIHRMLNHKNIIRFWGMRKEKDLQYLFLQYASGGELFDRIDPDVGMPQDVAQKYFRQLVDGLEYLHIKGVAHRDIKPENLLLDDKDNLKIADFGLATVFRHHGKWRHLDRLCGSAPYLAPEVISGKPYRAEPADLWSSAVVLVAMLCGELPWDAAVSGCGDYVSWRECHIEKNPWSKIDNLALCLLRRLLVERPDKRYTIDQIRENQWFKKDFTSDQEQQLSAGRRLRNRGSESDHSPGAISSSQPAMTSHIGGGRSKTSAVDGSVCGGAGDCAGSSEDRTFDTSGDDGPISFSQPTHTDNLLLSSQLNSTQQLSGTQSSQTPMQKLVRRMTRFFCRESRSQVMEELSRVLNSLTYTWKQTTSHVITVHTVDRRQTQLTMKIMILEMGENLLLDFRLSKGDGLEFKRHFLRIRDLMKAVICKVPPSWPNV